MRVVTALAANGRAEEDSPMIRSTAARRAAGLAAIFVLAGCAAGGTAPFTGGSGVQAGRLVDQRASWVAPGVTKVKPLLYVSDDGPNVVYIYSLLGKRLGQLAGFSFPEGLCTDANGDVFIANDNTSTILEYAHGSATLKATLSDPGYYPIGCSVDPTTGNLAVTNTYSTTSGDGSVAIYANAAGSPTFITDSVLVHPRLCGYDPNGNLYVDGFNSSLAFAFAELPKAAASFTDITLNQSIGFPESTQWDGKHIAVGDGDTNTIYQFAISGTTGTKVGSTVLTGAKTVSQWWISGKKVIGGDSGTGDLDFWAYPAGGAALKTITGLSQPFGTTISR
jgi:hypothetical protein